MEEYSPSSYSVKEQIFQHDELDESKKEAAWKAIVDSLGGKVTRPVDTLRAESVELQEMPHESVEVYMENLDIHGSEGLEATVYAHYGEDGRHLCRKHGNLGDDDLAPEGATENEYGIR
jgi:hypothetical protein